MHETFSEDEFEIRADSVGAAEFLEDQYTFCKNPLSKNMFWQTMENMEKLSLVQIDRSQPIEELWITNKFSIALKIIGRFSKI